MKMTKVLTPFLTACLLLALLFCASVASAGEILAEKTLEFDFTRSKEVRINIDFPLTADLSNAGAVSWEVKADELPGVSTVAMFFRSGSGWYSFGRMPEHLGAWEPLSVNVRDFGAQLSPAGLGKIDGMRVYVEIFPGVERRKVTLAFRNLRTCAAKKPARGSFAKDDPAAVAYVRGLRGGAKGERRLVWCHSPFGLDGASGWDETARRVKEAGFTDIIANLSWSGLAYYRSDVLPVYAGIGTKGDQLELAKAACRKYGVKLHAWHVCYQFPGRRDEPAKDALRQRVIDEDRFFRVMYGGREHVWMCPSDPRTQAHVIAAMVELAGKGLDGIHFDYIRHRDETNCNCGNCRARFRLLYGEDGSKWARFREQGVTEVVRTVARRVRREHPGLEISAAVQPIYWAVAQDWPLWCNEGWLDFVSPMDYTHITHAFRNQIQMQKGLLKPGCKAKIYPGIGLTSSHNWPQDGGDVRRVADHVLAVREEGYDGFTVFELQPRLLRLMPLLNETVLAP